MDWFSLNHVVAFVSDLFAPFRCRLFFEIAYNTNRTTIIEAIKYAITGALPPGGSKAGQNFVHDPRAMGVPQVKAQVKLRFTSRSAQTMVVVRSKFSVRCMKKSIVLTTCANICPDI